ncbi:S-layer family protein [Paenibacillus taihuensis]|uniref:S-layer family protein n=1 Tax=Paenibacillus taihuensis TaxID=1156355 RepID=A0A3D9SFE0_9BACL|nr:S-layer homology domain-containing protein [Paenibacillus taihuensis]REE87467.1 S-layer family protein [Paenibacillus taihuensis]
MINKKVISSIAITSLFFGASCVFAASGDNAGPIKGVKHQINDSGQDVNISSGLIGEKYEVNDSGQVVNTAGGVKPILNDISGNEAEETIRDLIAKGIVHGDNHNQFNPDKMIKREELATMVATMFDLQHVGTVQDFDDVPMNRWSYPSIEAAKNIFATLEPNSDTNFHPTAGIKREEATEVIIMAVMSKNPNVKLQDADAADQFLRSKISDTNAISISFRPYIATAMKNNLIEASDKGYFLPQDMLSRAQAATFLDRLFTNGLMSDDHSASDSSEADASTGSN